MKSLGPSTHNSKTAKKQLSSNQFSLKFNFFLLFFFLGLDLKIWLNINIVGFLSMVTAKWQQCKSWHSFSTIILNWRPAMEEAWRVSSSQNMYLSANYFHNKLCRQDFLFSCNCNNVCITKPKIHHFIKSCQQSSTVIKSFFVYQLCSSIDFLCKLTFFVNQLS